MKGKVMTGDEEARFPGRTSGIVYVLGHSTTPTARFVKILRTHSITTLIDIRIIPRSGHNPQFNSDALEKTLKEVGIVYVHLKALGGHRRPSKDSENTGWRNPSFRGYADYMQTKEFELGLDRLIALSRAGTVAIMCAEGNPYRCHRSLVADALTARGIRAVHISSGKPGRLHRLTPFARVTADEITYVERSSRGVSSSAK
jgi:uncharacterized protein (DUF488 family)